VVFTLLEDLGSLDNKSFVRPMLYLAVVLTKAENAVKTWFWENFPVEPTVLK